MSLERGACGLATCDLPEGVDPELVFESDGKGKVFCQGCAPMLEPAPTRSTWLRTVE